MRKKIAYINLQKTVIASGIIMLSFLFLRNVILDLFTIDIALFKLAGSILIFLLGMEMPLNISIFKLDIDLEKSSVISLTFPIIARTDTLSTLLTPKKKYQAINVLLANLVNALLTFFNRQIFQNGSKLSLVK